MDYILKAFWEIIYVHNLIDRLNPLGLADRLMIQ